MTTFCAADFMRLARMQRATKSPSRCCSKPSPLIKISRLPIRNWRVPTTPKAFFFKPQQKEWEEKAFIAVEKALSLNPDLAEAHLARGLLLWRPSNGFPHETVITEYSRALALKPNLDEAHYELGFVYYPLARRRGGERVPLLPFVRARR